MIKWICQNSDAAAVLVAAVSTFIAALSTLAAFWANRQSRKQYKQSIQPQLSMGLVEYGPWLYLRVKNTGKLPAKKVRITLVSIYNNGDRGELIPDKLFNNDFELYPEESVQGRVALHGRNIEQEIFPQIEINVTYDNGMSKKLCSYLRTVTYQSAYNEKIIADVNLNTRSIESSLGSIARANIRTANYLDGMQVSSFDERSILAQKSLRDDLLAVAGDHSESIQTRKETIKDIRKSEMSGQ